MNILIVKTSAIGDVIHTLPALNCLRRQYPEARIDWLVEEAAAEAVLGQRAVNRVLVSRRKQWLTLARSGKLRAAGRGFMEFVRELRSTHYDLLIDFQGLLKSGIFVWLARATRKVGFGRGMEHAEGSWLFLNERLPAVDMNLHAIARERLLLQAIGVPCDRVDFDFPVTDDHRRQVDSLLTANGVDLNRPLVVITPMTTWPTKHWYGDRFTRLADQLHEQGLTVVFSGGAKDAPAIAEMTAAMQRPAVNLAGRTTLKTLAALCARAVMVVSTDTGPMHIAAAMGTPVVALFGPTAPWRTGPYGAHHKVLRLELDCSPCLKRHCDKGHRCMAQLEVEQVLAAVRALL